MRWRDVLAPRPQVLRGHLKFFGECRHLVLGAYLHDDAAGGRSGDRMTRGVLHEDGPDLRYRGARLRVMHPWTPIAARP